MHNKYLKNIFIDNTKLHFTPPTPLPPPPLSKYENDSIIVLEPKA